MWRKRQALASDQKSWRALGLDSALWSGIEKNSGNVKTALGGTTSTTTEGIVTGLKFQNNSSTNPALPAPVAIDNVGQQLNICVSDPSNSAIPVTLGINQFDTYIDSSFNINANNGRSAKGLIFGVRNWQTYTGTTVGEDLSGIKYQILAGGSGYQAGDTFQVSSAKFGGAGGGRVLTTVTSVTSTKIEPGRN
jgi:hypothetical protein